MPEEREFFACLLQLLPDAVALARESDGILLQANQAFAQLTGYLCDELLGRPIDQSNLWPDPDLWGRLVEEVERTGALSDLETQLRRKDGQLVNVLVSARRMNLEGELCHLLTARDITRREQAEEQLRLEEQRLQFVLEGGQQGFWDWDLDTGEVRRNKRWAEMLGYTLEEIEFTVTQWTDLIHPDDRAGAWQSIQDHLKGRSPVHKREYRMRTKEGDYRWILDQATIVQRDPQGRPLRMSGTHTDITDRKRTEAEIKRLNEELEQRVVERTAQLNDTIQRLEQEAAERTRAEAELSGKTEELDRYFDTSQDLLAIADTDGYLRRLNPAWEKTLGYARHEMEGQLLTGFIHPEDLAATLQAITTLSQQQEVLDFVNRYRTQKGDYRWLEWRAFPMGRMVYAMGRDITARRQAEAALRSSEEAYRELVENINDVIYTTDPTGVLTYLSPPAERVLGYTPSDAVGRSVEVFVHHDDLPMLRQSFQDVLANRAHPNEYRVWTKTGEIRWVRTSSRPVMEGGNVVGVRGVLVDITARKEAEEALRASEEAYRDLVENVNDVLYSLDRIGVITYASPAVERFLSFASSEVMGRSFWPLIHPDDLPKVEQDFQEVLAGSLHPSEFRMVGKTGEVRWVRSSSRPVGEGDSVTGLRGVLVDITDRKQAEEEASKLQAQLLQSQKLAALGEVISGIAHELNNPLAAVVAYAHLLQQRELTGGAADDAKSVEESALRASRVVHNLLAFARRQEPRRTPVTVNEVVEQALVLRAAHLSASGIDVVTHLTPDLPLILADHQQLEQVLINLINNAERALLDQSGRRQLTVGTQAAGDWLEVRVADTGVGIPEDIRDLIFEPFFTTQEVGRGTGLGLSICHAIVSDHGGRISVSSRLGEGSEFLVQLPVALELPVTEEAHALPAVSLTGVYALVVEDEILVRLPLVRMLEEIGMRVISASSGATALQALEGGKCQLIVCDMKMPEMDGRAFHDEVSRRWPSLAERFIICTGDTLNPDTVAFAETIGAPLLAKPFLIADVKAAVAAAVGGDGPGLTDSGSPRPPQG